MSHSSNLSVNPTQSNGRPSWKMASAIYSLRKDPADLIISTQTRAFWPPTTNNTIIPDLDMVRGSIGDELFNDLSADRQAGQAFFSAAALVFLRKMELINSYTYARYEAHYQEIYEHSLHLREDIHAEANLWKLVYEILCVINRADLWVFPWPHVHPAKALASMVQERLLIGFIKGDPGGMGADKYLREQREVNNYLRDFDLLSRRNPFRSGTVPHLFVEICHQHLQHDDQTADFESAYWMPMIDARARQISICSKGAFLMDGDSLLAINPRVRQKARSRRRGRPKGSTKK